MRVERPIFLVGAERSGTTLLRLMLDHHPRIAFHEEFAYAVELVGEDGEFPDVEKYCQWLQQQRGFRLRNYALDRRSSYPDLLNSFLWQKIQRDKSSQTVEVVGATIHRHFDRVLFIWPDARFIHIVREGRDVARSRVKMGWAGNVWVGAAAWVEVEAQWTHLQMKPDSDSRWIEVKYENLVTRPRETLASICDFAGVQYDDRMLSYTEHTSYGPSDPQLAQQWRRTLTEKEVRLVEARAGTMLEHRGYALSGLPRLTVGPALRLVLLLHHRLRTAEFRIQRYGLGLVLAKALARRLRLRRIHQRLTLYEHEITNAYLKR